MIQQLTQQVDTVRTAVPTALVVLTVVLVSTAGFTGIVMASDYPTDEPSFVVDLASDGSAEITVTQTFDLSDADRQVAFNELQDNESAQTAVRDRFENRMSSVAAETSEETNRDVTVTDPSITLHSTGDTGIVTLSVTMHELADVTGDSLTVSEPFASGFEPNAPFHVVLPDGYEVVTTDPTPDEQDDSTLTWAQGTSLDGFTVEATTGETGTSSTGASGPGFGVVVAVVGLLAVALVAVRRYQE